MTDSPDFFRRLATLATWLTAFFSIVAAAAAFMQGAFVSKATQILGVVVAVLAVVSLLCERRANALDERFKRIPPKLTVKAIRESADKVKFGVLSENFVPFECQWFVCREDNQIVGAIPGEWTKFVPRKTRQGLVAVYHLHAAKAHGALKLIFQFRSPYIAEVDDAEGLHGSITVPVEEPPPAESS